MVGRDVPLGELSAVLAGARDGAPVVALISGEAGIGKTRLVEEVETAADGFTVLHGECVEFGPGHRPVAVAPAKPRRRAAGRKR